MYKEFAEFTGALYADKVMLAGLTEIEIAALKGEKNRLDHKGFNPDYKDIDGLTPIELTATIDGLLAQEPNDKVLILMLVHGKWLKYNHPDFMDKPIDN